MHKAIVVFIRALKLTAKLLRWRRYDLFTKWLCLSGNVYLIAASWLDKQNFTMAQGQKQRWHVGWYAGNKAVYDIIMTVIKFQHVLHSKGMFMWKCYNLQISFQTVSMVRYRVICVTNAKNGCNWLCFRNSILCVKVSWFWKISQATELYFQGF